MSINYLFGKKLVSLIYLVIFAPSIMWGGAVVARRAHNPKVISSNLVPATTKALMQCIKAFSFCPFSKSSLFRKMDKKKKPNSCNEFDGFVVMPPFADQFSFF